MSERKVNEKHNGDGLLTQACFKSLLIQEYNQTEQSCKDLMVLETSLTFNTDVSRFRYTMFFCERAKVQRRSAFHPRNGTNGVSDSEDVRAPPAHSG